MKQKKVLNKKLVLNKNTIADLNHRQMKDLIGGELTDTECPSLCDPSCKPIQCDSLICTGTCQVTVELC